MSQYMTRDQWLTLIEIVDTAQLIIRTGEIDPIQVQALRDYVIAVEAEMKQDEPPTLGVSVSETIQTNDKVGG